MNVLYSKIKSDKNEIVRVLFYTVINLKGEKRRESYFCTFFYHRICKVKLVLETDTPRKLIKPLIKFKLFITFRYDTLI